MINYPWAVLDEDDIEELQVARVRELETELARVMIQGAEQPGLRRTYRRQTEIVGRLEVHRAALGLPSALSPETPSEPAQDPEPGAPDPADPQPGDEPGADELDGQEDEDAWARVADETSRLADEPDPD